MKKFLSITLLCTSLLAIGILDKADVKASEKTDKIAQLDGNKNLILYLRNGDFQSDEVFWTNNHGFELKTEGNNRYLSSTLSGGNFIHSFFMPRAATDPTTVTLDFATRRSSNAYVTLIQMGSNGDMIDQDTFDIPDTPNSSTWTDSSHTVKVNPDTVEFRVILYAGNPAGTNIGSLDIDNINLYCIK